MQCVCKATCLLEIATGAIETAQLDEPQDKMDNSLRRGLPTWDVENKNITVIRGGRPSMLFVVIIGRTYALPLFKSW
jgi:hypothetical protein